MTKDDMETNLKEFVKQSKSDKDKLRHDYDEIKQTVVNILQDNNAMTTNDIPEDLKNFGVNLTNDKGDFDELKQKLENTDQKLDEIIQLFPNDENVELNSFEEKLTFILKNVQDLKVRSKDLNELLN